ncbi:MAG: polysaccharide deacetylase family protein [Flavobacteriaceae bacterium]
MKRQITFILAFIVVISVTAQKKNWAEKLGYAPDTKLLILHADDLGMAHSENMASIYGLEESPVNSASIMVPCPWFPEIATYAQQNKHLDFGLHLTLTSEWKNYKWGPITSKNLVPGLLNKKGYFYASVDSLLQTATKEEVFLELDNQVKKALDFGIDVTHLDTHMRAAMGSEALVEVYIEVGKKYQLPVFLHKDLEVIHSPKIQKLLNENDIIIDETYTATPADFENGMEQYYMHVLNNLKPGLNNLLIHLAYDDTEMQAITIDHPNWGATWRQHDYDFFTSETCKELLKKNNIILVTWRELRDVSRKP